MKYNQIKIYLTLSLVFSIFVAQSQTQVKIKLPQDRHAPGKIVEADVPKFLDGFYSNAKKEAYIFLRGGGGTAYAYNVSTRRFRQLNNFNKAYSIYIIPSFSGDNGVVSFTKSQKRYLYNPAKGRTFALPDIKAEHKSGLMFDGVYLYRLVHMDKKKKVGLLSYMDVHKDTRWRTLLLSSAVNKAIQQSKFKKPKHQAYGFQFFRVGTKFFVITTYTDQYASRDLIVQVNLSGNSQGLKITGAKAIGYFPRGGGLRFPYRGKLYVTQNQTTVFGSNGTKIAHYPKSFYALMQENKIPSIKKKFIVTPGGRIRYPNNSGIPINKNNSNLYINGKTYNFSIKERTYARNQQNKVKPYWFLRVTQK